MRNGDADPTDAECSHCFNRGFDICHVKRDIASLDSQVAEGGIVHSRAKAVRDRMPKDTVQLWFKFFRQKRLLIAKNAQDQPIKNFLQDSLKTTRFLCKKNFLAAN